LVHATSKKGIVLVAIVAIVSIMKLRSELSAKMSPKKDLTAAPVQDKELKGRGLFSFRDINWNEIVDTRDWNFDEI